MTSVPIRSWASDATRETRMLFSRIARLADVVHHVAAMADAHACATLPVGSVFATREWVYPAALGSDWGCGMLVLRISNELLQLDHKQLEELLRLWKQRIPSDSRRAEDFILAPPVLEFSTGSLHHAFERTLHHQWGTLGGGNHFVELSLGSDEALWLLVHSGSRGLGGAASEHYRRALCAQKSASGDLIPLSTQTPLGQGFLRDHDAITEFARAHRKAIARQACHALNEVAGEALSCDLEFDVCHNFVRQEHWFDEDLWIHRKGAAPAHAGQLAVIAGSMGTPSFVVRGLGNPHSFGSCSHGAGRVLSRTDARHTISEAAHQASLGDVVAGSNSRELPREESPRAYRDIRKVIDAQRDLVERAVRLAPLVNLK